MIDKEPRVTARFVHTKLQISDTHISRLKNKMKKQRLIVEKKSPGGGTSSWLRPEIGSEPSGFINEKENADKVLAFLRTNSWVTTHMLVVGIKLTWYPAKRTLEYLVGKGMVKSVKKTNNPNHKGKASFNRRFDYWEVV